MFAKGNMEKISATIPINISTKQDIMENVHIRENSSPQEISTFTALFKELCDVFSWSYEEMSGIDPSIVEHAICTYPNVKPI